MKEIGYRLKTLRKGRKLTQQEIADKLGIVRATWSNYETGRRSPHISELKRIADFFGVSIEYFGVSTQDESFELISRAKDVFNDSNIPMQEKQRVYKEIMKIYLAIEE